MKRRDFIYLSTGAVLGTGIFGYERMKGATLQGQSPEQPNQPWWNRQWRYRTTVRRPTPLRHEGEGVFESAIDFPHLLGKAGVTGEFDANSIRVVERKSGDAFQEVPAAYRSEYNPRTDGIRNYVTWYGSAEIVDVYFDTKERAIAPPAYPSDSLPPGNLLANAGLAGPELTLPAGWSVAPPALAGLDHSEGKPALRVLVNAKTRTRDEEIVTIAQRIDVSRFAGRAMVFQCDLIAKHAPYGAPVAIELRQFRKDGSQIPECAVQARWLCILLAEGQLVQFDECGRFNPEAAEVEVNVRIRCAVKDADTGLYLSGEPTDFDVRLYRFSLRPGEQWPWPELTQAGFVAGALSGEPHNFGFHFTGARRLAFMTASEGTLTMGVEPQNPRAVHWGRDQGTLEFWCKPSWDSADGVEHVLFSTTQRKCVLRKTGAKENNQIEFLVTDSAGKALVARTPAALRRNTWHHVAATWDSKSATLQIFIDGKNRAVMDAQGQKSRPPVDETNDDEGDGKRPADWSVAAQAFIGGDSSWTKKTSAEAVLDEFRISDSVRYDSRFTPSKQEFPVDEFTRALFHLDHERDGVHAGDDAFVRGHLACELPPQAETCSLDRWQDDRIATQSVLVSPYAPEALFSANRPDERYRATRTRPFRALPDHRFVEYRERQAEFKASPAEQTLKLRVGGDYGPLMRSTTTSLIAPVAGKPVFLPQWRANRNVVPFSMEDLRATLGLEGKSDEERLLIVYQYMLTTTNYYNPLFCETLPTQVRKRISYTFLRQLNMYAFDQCGPLNEFMRKAFLTAGISSANAQGTGHQIEQAFYQGDWRLVDNSSRFYCLDRDNKTIASRRRIEEDPYLMIREGGHINAYLRDRKGEATFDIPERPHNMDFPLRFGETISFCWHNEGRSVEATYLGDHFRGHRFDVVHPLNIARIAPSFGNGTVVFALNGNSGAVALENIDRASLTRLDPRKPGSLVYHLKSPYILSDLNIAGPMINGQAGAVTLAVSYDAGKTWTEAGPGGRHRGLIKWNLMPHVTSRYEYWLKFSLGEEAGVQLQDFSIRTTFLQSPLALPGRLALGENDIRFAGGAIEEPVKTSCRWVERYKSDLGVALNTISYYMDGDASLRNLLVFDPRRENRLTLKFLGRKFGGTIRIDGLPEGWSASCARYSQRQKAHNFAKASHLHLPRSPKANAGGGERFRES